jgi:peptidyl-prolyl cis-trans isomerase SurA
MKSILLAVILVLANHAVFAQEDGASRNTLLLDRVVAVVNDEVVTQLELAKEVDFAVRQLTLQGTPLPERDALERQVLERMITSRILVQNARRTGIRVPDGQLNKAIDRMAAENKMSGEQFREAMEEQGIDISRFRERIRVEIMIARLKEREVDNKVTITEAEIDSYLRSQVKSGSKDDEYKVAHILVLVPEGASPDEIRTSRDAAEDALRQLKEGADFGQVAASVSDAGDALEGGMLGWRTAAQLPELFVDAVSGLRVGAVSDALRSANGFHIVKLYDKRGNTATLIVQQTHAQHILIRLNEVVSEQDSIQRLADLKARMEMGDADFGDLARQHSDDGSAAKGGDLGWLSPGETVPEFERAMNALQPGEVSDPVRTPFGLHLIKVLERRDEDLSEERQRVMARQTIRLRKADSASQEWVRQQRDKAYVDDRLEES